MFIIWRKFVTWLRSILLSFFNKTPINWDKKLSEISEIIDEVAKKTKNPPVIIDAKINEKPTITPVLPNYDILPKRKRLFRRIFDGLFK